MKTPIIGLTTYHGNNEQGFPAVMLLRAYVKAVIEAGGTPLLVPTDLPATLHQELVERLDGILFTGGGDISLRCFDGESHPRIHMVDELRDALEISLFQVSLQQKKSILGICRGCQLINVALGGSLYTHIEDQHVNAIKHDYYPAIPRSYIAHGVHLDEESRLAGYLGKTELEVNSLHHQGLNRVAAALQAVARAPDGLVEAVEISELPFVIGVQWHPEWLTHQPAAQALFKAFVESARISREKGTPHDDDEG